MAFCHSIFHNSVLNISSTSKLLSSNPTLIVKQTLLSKLNPFKRFSSVPRFPGLLLTNLNNFSNKLSSPQSKHSHFRETFSVRASSSMAAQEQKKVLVPVSEEIEEMEAVIIIDVLRRSGADVTVASIEDELSITASRGVKLVADDFIKFQKDKKFDLIALPGGKGAERLRDSEILQQIVEKHASSHLPYAAICASPVVVLKSWNLIGDLKATAHPFFSSELNHQDVISEAVVEDRNLITSRGPGTAMDFALALVRKLYGKEKEEAVAAPMVMPKKDGSDISRLAYDGAFTKPFLSSETQAKVLVPIANGSEEMEAVIIIDVLRRANAQVIVASVEDQLQVKASRSVHLVADEFIQNCENMEFDLIALPGGMPGAERLNQNKILNKILKKQIEKNKLFSAICASPAVVLEASGMLKGKIATAHPAFSGKLSNQEAVEARVVGHGLLTTSRGPGTAMEFALSLVECLYGKEKAKEVAEPMVIS